MNQPRVFRFLNQTMIVDNGIRKIISDTEAMKSDNEILKSYNATKKGGAVNGEHDNT